MSDVEIPRYPQNDKSEASPSTRQWRPRSGLCGTVNGFQLGGEGHRHVEGGNAQRGGLELAEVFSVRRATNSAPNPWVRRPS